MITISCQRHNMSSSRYHHNMSQSRYNVEIICYFMITILCRNVVSQPALRSEPASGNTSLPDVDSPRFAENTSGTRNMFIRRLGALWALWDRSEAVLEPSWASPGSPWGLSWASLGPSWAPLGLSWRSPGALLGALFARG